MRPSQSAGTAGSAATDIAGKMVQHTAHEARRRGLSQVECIRMGAEALEFPDGAFDAGLCALGLMYVPDIDLALREMRRVLRCEAAADVRPADSSRNARAVAAVWGARNRCGWAEIFPIIEARVQSDVCPTFFQLGTGSSLEERFRGAGFSAVETRRISTELCYPSADVAADAAFAGGPVAMAYSRFDAATRDSARADYIASIAPFRDAHGYRIPGEFVIARAII